MENSVEIMHLDGTQHTMFHHKDELYFGRKADGSVRILKLKPDHDPRLEWPPPNVGYAYPDAVLDVTIPSGEWASIVDATTARLAEVLGALNSAFDDDPAALYALLCNRVPCNRALADHPTVQVDAPPVAPGTYYVGALGLLNGVLGALGLPLVASEWSEPDDEGRRQLKGFTTYNPPPDLVRLRP